MSISVLNTDAGLSGKTILNIEDAQTVTGLKSFDRDPNPPFVVSAGSAVVTNLDADKVDGIEGSDLMPKTGGTFTGNVLFTDDTYDIGDVGASRPRDFHLSRNAIIGGTLAVTGIPTFTAESVHNGGIDCNGAANISGVATVASGTATPANGSSAARLLFGTTSGFGIYYGSGAPTVSAAQGSLYLRSDGSSTTTRIYLNLNGAALWDYLLCGS